jgi:O-antigen/teichoic acid export membrane protein
VLRDSAFSLLSTAVRLLASLVLFVVLAHVWGPSAFGVFMYPFTVAAIAVKVVDYGFASQVARDAGRAPERVGDIFALALGAKVVLVAVAVAVGLVVAAFLPRHDGYVLLLAVLLADAILNSFVQLFSVPLRALGRFHTEAGTACAGNVLVFATSVATAWAGGGPIAVAAAFAISRLCQLVLAVRAYADVVGAAPRASVDGPTLRATLRDGLPFAVHMVVGTLNLHSDTLMVQRYLGAESVGIYQAGMRLLFGALLVADALNNVYLASLARATSRSDEIDRLGTRMTRHLLALGVVAFACMLGGSEWVVGSLFEPRYAPLVDLVPLFGLLVLIRYAGVSYGTLLTLTDRQAARMVAVAGVLALSLCLNALLIPRFGLRGALTASIVSHLILYSVYGVVAWRDHRSLLIDRRSGTLLLAVVAAIPVLALPGTASVSMRLEIGAALLAAGVLFGVTRAEWATLSRRLVRVD